MEIPEDDEGYKTAIALIAALHRGGGSGMLSLWEGTPKTIDLT